ncbi:hypothetical protein BU15DRAFT_70054 [Melanogaster broomeanus]|nr:hypothetical protein BU15DRAFT_70054 [Melanogaster broomeanus]
MPFNMFKAFSGGSRNRGHQDDHGGYPDFPQGYPAPDYQPQPTIRPQPRQVLRRSSMKRREPLFTPLPSRVPTDGEDYHDGYLQVDNPDAVMGGALNVRPTRLEMPFPSVERHGDDESPVSESLSEREHREHGQRLHDPPRLLDQPPHGAFAHAGERAGSTVPIVMSPPQRHRSSTSESDHTIENLRTPLSMHPSQRVIPPLPPHYAGSHISASKPPTDIYGGHPQEVRPYRNPEIYSDRHNRGASKGGPIYYIIPGGMNVIFQDEHGNEITR